MNRFLGAATPEFKRFIDEICSWDPTQNIQHEPKYQAAFQIKPRLPPISREGLPALPFLLDAPKSMATLVDIWVENAPSNIIDTGIDECVQNFHRLCLKIKQRTQDCMTMAEAAQEPNTGLEGQWQRMLSEQPKGRFVFNPFDSMMAEHDITALPQTPNTPQVPTYHPSLSRRTTTDEFSPVEQRQNDTPRRVPTRTVTNSTISSNVSSETSEDVRARNPPKSREDAQRLRFLDVYNQRPRDHLNGEMI